MQAQLEITTGPHAGERIVVEAGRPALVGRDKPSRHVFPLDAELLKIHFQLRFDGAKLSVRACDPKTGLLVNGRSVTHAPLQDGDLIEAGTSLFLVRLTSEPLVSHEAEAAPVEAAPSVSMSAAAEPLASPGRGLRSSHVPTLPATPSRSGGLFSRPVAMPMDPSPSKDLPAGAPFLEKKCPSGFYRYRPRRLTPTPSEMIRFLSSLRPLYVLLNTPEAPALPSELREHGDLLLDWLAPDSAQLASPRVIGPGIPKYLQSDIEAAWGKTGLVCLCSPLEPPVLLQHLRTHARQSKDGVLGFFIPKVFAMLLSSSVSTMLSALMEGIDVLLMESPCPGRWEMYAREAFRENLIEGGFFIEAPSADAEKADPDGEDKHHPDPDAVSPEDSGGA